MYGQYMYGSFAPVAQTRRSCGDDSGGQPQGRQGEPLNSLIGILSGLLRGPGRQSAGFHPDTGDILLLLIVLFLCFEGDDLELVITLGLMLILGFDGP